MKAKVKPPFFLLTTFNYNSDSYISSVYPSYEMLFPQRLLHSPTHFFPHLSMLHASRVKFFAEVSELFRYAVSALGCSQNGVLGVHPVSHTSDLLTKTQKCVKFTPIYVRVIYYFPLCTPCRYMVECWYSSIYISIVGPTRCTFCIQFIMN
jgi:hypothetical protein